MPVVTVDSEPVDACDDDARPPAELVELHEVLDWVRAVEGST